MEFLFLMGVLLIVLTIVLFFRVQLKVEDETCSQDVEAVKTNKVGLAICAIVGVLCAILGLIL